MKTRIISCLAVVAALLLFASGCKKEEHTTSDKPKMELITQGSWKFNKAVSSGLNVSGFIETCQKDNIVTLQADGSGTLDEGDTKCDAGDPQTLSFTWNFASNETVLHVSTSLFTGGSSDFDLVNLNETELVVSQYIELSGGGSQKVTVTFVH